MNENDQTPEWWAIIGQNLTPEYQPERLVPEPPKPEVVPDIHAMIRYPDGTLVYMGRAAAADLSRSHAEAQARVDWAKWVCRGLAVLGAGYVVVQGIKRLRGTKSS